MLSTSLIHPNESCLFSGFRNPLKDGAPDIYHTLSHWFESEKFRGVDEALRESILQAPSPSESRKIAIRHKDRCRIDWRAMKARILKAGLMMAAEQNIDVRNRMGDFAKTTSLEINIEFEEGRTICGHPLTWYAGVMWDASEAYINRPARVLFAAGRKITYEEKAATIDKFISIPSITQVLVPITKDASPIGEEFALRHGLPVHYYYPARGKLSLSCARELATDANQIMVLERKGGKQFDQLITNAKALGKTVKLTLI